jgi:hypothetical protein
MSTPKRFTIGGLILTAATLSSTAGTFNSDFNSGLPAGTAVYGNTVVEATGGVGDSGVLKVTKAINSQQGSFVIEDFDAGATVYGFDVNFDVLLGPGNPPADGMAFCFGTLPDSGWGENGPGGNCLAVSFQLYPFGGDDAFKPNINVSMNNNKFVTHKYDLTGTNGILTYPDYAHVHIRLNANGSLDMDYKGQTIFTNVFVPGYAGAAGRFGVGGRTGGANANQWVDNLQITSLLVPNVGISQQPFSQKVLTGEPAVFEAQINNSDGVTYQWFKGTTAVPGATTPILTIPAVAAADAGIYHLVATGPNNVATSVDATLTVVNLVLPPVPQLSMNFNDGLVPANTTVVGTAMVNAAGGVGGSGSLQLTAAANDQSGAFIVADPNAGAAVYGFTAQFDMTAGGGTAPPADGFAFAFGTDIPDSPTGEFEAGAGLGNGLRVTFDIYNNDGIYGTAEGGQPAPSIDVRLGSQVIGTVHLPLSFMETPADTYGDTIIQMDSDGTINVVYRGVLVFDKLPVPGFVSYSGGRFALAARTGGLNANMSVDNLDITSVTTPGALRIATQPTPQTSLVGKPATFTVAVNDTVGTTYQWMRGGSPIAGATSTNYTIPATVVADSGALFKVQVTKGAAVVTSSEVSLSVVDLAVPTAPVLTLNFNDGLVPTNTAVSGNAFVTNSGGVGDSGMLVLTLNQNGQGGGFLIQPLLGGAEVSALWASFDLHISEGTGRPADGLSFNYGPDVGGSGSGPEPSNAGGLSIVFDTYDNGGGEAPAIEVRWKGQIVSSTKGSWSTLIDTGAGFRTVLVRVNPAGVLDCSYGDLVIANGLQLPNYSFITGGKYAFYANTGGENENHWVDNINLQPTKSSAPLGIAVQPADISVIEGHTATFSVQLTDPVGATYQWFKGSTAIAGATQSSYTTPATVIGDNGATFKVHAVGPGGAIDSRAAVLTIVQPITIANPQVTFDFNDGQLPFLPPPNNTVQTILNGSGEGNGNGGYIDATGGVTNSGVLKLTDAINGEGGTFIVPDFNNGQPVRAFTAYFAVLVGGGSAVPADGFSFVWANDLTPDTIVFGENGSGSGLTVGFDIYRNTTEAPSFNIFYKGVPVVSKLVDISALTTGDVFEDVYIRLNPEGTVDLQYKGNVIFDKVALPGFSAMSGGRFAWGGRTGGLNENQWVDNIKLATTVGQAAVSLGWTTTGNNLSLTWPTGWKLQSTTTIAIPNSWQDVPNAVSPYTAPTTTGPGTFYRLINSP